MPQKYAPRIYLETDKTKNIWPRVTVLWWHLGQSRLVLFWALNASSLTIKILTLPTSADGVCLAVMEIAQLLSGVVCNFGHVIICDLLGGGYLHIGTHSV